MVEAPPEVPTELAHLPPDGTPERLEWETTLQQVNELYPDWSSIRVGHARLSRAAYEKQGQEGDTGPAPLRSERAVVVPRSRGRLSQGAGPA